MNKVLTGKVLSANISEKKGIIKTPQKEIVLYEKGVLNDAHSGDWNRMVSLLAKESFDAFEAESGRKTMYGEFAENITTEGIVLHELLPLDILEIGNKQLQITQIGKECHGSSCAIFKEVGNCVMPREGIFARVLKGGTLKADEEITVVPYVFNIKIITLSDRASQGIYEDRSGPEIQKLLQKHFYSLRRDVKIDITVIPDDAQQLLNEIRKAIDDYSDAIFTTGGTGIGPRDITPDTVKKLIDKEIPGIMEMIRFKYGQTKPAALLSRSIAGTIGKTLIYTLPGSVRAVREYCAEILPTINHSVFMLNELDIH